MKKCRTEQQIEENNQTTDELSSLSASVLTAKFNFTKHDLFLDFYSKDFF